MDQEPSSAACAAHHEGSQTPASVEPAYRSLRAALRRFVAKRVRAEHVDDLLQDVFLRMHENVGKLEDETRLAAWAFRIAQSVVADHYRKRRPEMPSEAEVEKAMEAEDSEDSLVGNANEQVAAWLRPMLQLLPEEYREAVELVELQGLSQKEYAERAGLSLSGAKSRVQRGRRMLGELVQSCCALELDTRGNVLGYTRRRDACACAETKPGPGGECAARRPCG